MRLHGMAGRHRRRRCRTTFPGPDGYQIPDLVGRRFDPGAPDVAWCQDITYIPTREGWLYLASVLDLGSRRLIGYSMADHMRTELVLDALDHGRRRPRRRPRRRRRDRPRRPGISVHHQRLPRLLPCPSDATLGRRTGVCWDNAVAESFWESLKRECLQAACSPPAPKPAGRSSGGSTGTTRPGFTAPSTTSHPSSGNSSTVKRHNHPSGRRGDAQTGMPLRVIHVAVTWLVLAPRGG